MSLRLSLFGPPAAIDGERRLALRCERRTQLLALLAFRGTWVGRVELAGMLWPDQPIRLANTNLRKALFRAQALPWSAALQSNAGALRFAVPTDVADFETAVREGRLDTAVALRQGEFLFGFDDLANEPWTRWLGFERDRLRALWRTAALQHLATELAPLAAVELAARVLEDDPLDETGVSLCMTWLARTGQGARARRVYQEFVVRLNDELGLSPGAELTSLHDSLGVVAASAQPAATAPARDQSFVGRTVETRRIVGLLAQDDCRLLTVCGPGGVGKTSLVRHALIDLAARHADGAAFVPLEDIAAADQLGGRLARELEVVLAGNVDPFDQVIAHLSGRKFLIVLDNFEQLAADAAILDRLLVACPGVKLLVTSRVRLGLAGEWLLPLEGLACPDEEDVDHAESFDAVRLFVRAAQRVAPDLDAVTAAPAIVDICRQVGGLPLALELAATWTRVLSCDAIAAELRRGAELLATTDPAHAPRHASIETVFEQSWQRLIPVERNALSKLSVFQGGFSVEAARAVVGSALPVLAALADKSLLRKDGARLHLHPLVQQFAARKLDAAAERAAAEGAHATHFNELLHQMRRGVEFGDRDALATLDAEFENVRAAWRWAAQHLPTQLVKSVHTLSHYCDHRSRLEEGLALLREALAAPGVAAEPSLEALLLGKSAHLDYRSDRYALSIDTATRGLQRLRSAGVDEPDALAQCLKVLGTCELRLGRPAEAKRYLKQSLRLVPVCSDPRHAAAMLSGLAISEKLLGNYDEAQRLTLEALEQQRRLGDVASEALSLNNIAALLIERQQFEAAGEYLKPALVLCDRHGLVTTRIYVLTNLAGVATKLGRQQDAESFAQRALEHAQAAANRFVVSFLRLLFVRFALRRDDLNGARAELKRAMEIALEVGRPALLSEGIAVFAELLAAQGELACARAVTAFAAEHPATVPLERDELRRALARLPATDVQIGWPGWTLEEVARRTVAENELAFAPMIAALRRGQSQPAPAGA